MSDINVFYTQPIQTVANPAPSGKTGQLGGGHANFFDLIFAHLAGLSAGQDLPTGQESEESTADHSANDLAAVIPSSPDSSQADFNKEDAAFGLDILPENDLQGFSQENITLDAAGIKKLQQIMDSLTAGIPADHGKITADMFRHHLKNTMPSPGFELEADMDPLANGDQNLIATGLNPEDITTLMAMIHHQETAHDDAALQALLGGTVQIVSDYDAPQAVLTQTVFLPKAIIVSKQNGAQHSSTEKSAEKTIATMTALNTTAIEETDIPGEGIKSLREARFDDLLKTLELAQGKASDARGGASLGAQNSNSQAGIMTQNAPAGEASGKHGPVNSSFTADFAGLSGSLLGDGDMSGVFPEGMDWSQNNPAASHSQITGTAQLTSIVTQASSATQPHPATMFVAATLAKSAKNGEPANMTLRMDPPELGKIEIHMHFTKNKEVKTHMVFEKPETMMMMQRDSQMLERSLQESGLDGNALSFELADEGHDFENSGKGNGNDYGKADKNMQDDMDVIETTMGWSVDHATGLQHYNILA